MNKRGRKRMIKKGLHTLWGVWCVVVTLITPVWLTLTYLNLSGQIYKYDSSMDEGTAIIFGIVMAMVWLFLFLLPSILFYKRIYSVNHKYGYIFVVIIALAIVFCMVHCRWDVLGFLTAKNII